MSKLKAEVDAYADWSMAYNNGKTAAENPYEADSIQGIAWLNGWSDTYDFDNSIPSEFDFYEE